MLREQKLFCSDPHSVNDPWDCKPWFDYRPMLEDPLKREAMITFLRSAATRETLLHPFRKIYEDQLRKDNNELVKAVEACSRILGNELAKRRIYCLTPFSDSTLMWSHYAANHRGICLEFDKNNELIGRARPVRYSTIYPEWTPHGVTDPLELVFTKSMDWAYEREFRIIASAQSFQLTKAGYYQLRLANGRQNEVGVNPDPKESNLDVISDDVLALWQGKQGQAAPAAGPAASTQPAGPATPRRTPQSIWWYIMLLVLASGIAESVVASRYLGTQREES